MGRVGLNEVDADIPSGQVELCPEAPMSITVVIIVLAVIGAAAVLRGL